MNDITMAIKRARQEQKPEVQVFVSGGVVQDVTIPGNCKLRVLIRDYDIEGSDPELIDQDDNNDPCITSVYQN